MNGRAESACSRHHFLQRLHHPRALLPHVDGDGHAAFTQRRQRVNELLCRIEDLRRIAKPERHAERAAGKALLYQAVYRMKRAAVQRLR